MMLVGVTGVISSGKSTVLAMFEDLGAQTSSSDDIVLSRMKKGTNEYRCVKKKFGLSVMGNAGNISKAKLRRMVRQDPKALSYLEKIFHPSVRREIIKKVRCYSKRRGILAVEIPLLFESGMQKLMDRIVVVTAPSKRLRRFSEWKGVKREDFDIFLKRQWPQGQKAKLADYVIRNNDTLSCLRMRAKEVYFRLLKKDQSTIKT